MDPNLWEEQQVIIVIKFFCANTPKGLHICYVPTAYIDMCYKNKEEMKPKRSVSTKWSKIFLKTLYVFSPDLLIINVAGYLHSLVWRGLLFFISCQCFRAWFRRRVSEFEYIWETKTCDRPFWFSFMKADSIFSENFQLTIFATKYGGDLFDDVPLLCTLCALSMFFEISSLEVSGKTLDIWFIKTDLVSDQKLWPA